MTDKEIIRMEKAIEDAMWGFEPNDNGDYEYADMEEMFMEGAKWQKKQIMKNAISMDVYYETEWDDIHKFLRKNLDGEKVKLLIIKED